MDTTWIGAAHSTPGRQGAAVELLVIHWMAGTLAATDATFTAGVREASAHYGVEGAAVHGYVPETDTAWALGDWPANLRSISIEVSAEPGRDASPETIATVIGLATDICRRHGLTAADIAKHSDFKNTQCPGTVPVEQIRAAVAARLNGTTPQEEQLMAKLDQDDREFIVEQKGAVLDQVWGTAEVTHKLIQQLAGAINKLSPGALDLEAIATAVADEQAERMKK
jgi:N-acetyl-anhydromuramyl-L-alanine amidase AmpD